MREKLVKLLENSYSPYSNFRVSAIVVMKDDREFCGVNVENASYGASICAERSAILSAVSAGYKKGDFKEIHDMVSSGKSFYVMCDNNDKVGKPCFVCRMTLVEFFDRDSKVICMTPDGQVEEYLISDLCPYPFDSEDLK